MMLRFAFRSKADADAPAISRHAAIRRRRRMPPLPRRRAFAFPLTPPPLTPPRFGQRDFAVCRSRRCDSRPLSISP